MSDERQQNPKCEQVRDELLSAACDVRDVNSLSNGTRVHLSSCAACRGAWLEERELLSELRTALRPAPLADATVERIWKTIEAGATDDVRRVIRPRSIGWAAVAAAVVLAIVPTTTWWLVSQRGIGGSGAGDNAGGDRIAVNQSNDATDAVALTQDERAAVVEALTFVAWDAPVGEGLSTIALTPSTFTNATAATTNSAQVSASVLPWGSDDDWDRPQRDAERDSSRRDDKSTSSAS